MGMAVGVDLGTTNSSIACYHGFRERVPTFGKPNAVPSVVAYLDDGATAVGARARRSGDPEATIGSAKRFLGPGYPAVADSFGPAVLEVVRGVDGSTRFDIRGHRVAPEAVCAHVVRALVDGLARRVGEPFDEVVVTVPALSTDGQRRATREACRIAGLDVVRIMNEPTAAALAYSLDRPGQETIMVFDLGGGTLDVAVVEIGFGIVEVRAVAGEAHLGGDDFDRVIAGHLADELSGGPGVDLRQDPRIWRRLLEATEKAKVRLSTAARTRVSVGLGGDRGARRVGTTLTRETVESLTGDLVAACLTTARRALAEAGLAVDDLDEVIILGRAARMPAIRAMIRTLTGGRLPRTSVERDGLVARGAAVQAAALRGAVCDALVWDVTPVSLFARTPDGRSTAIVRGNTATPVTRTIAVPGRPGPAGDVVVVEERGDDLRVLGRVLLDQRSARIPELRLMFHVDADGILSASTQDPDTGLELPVPIVPSTGPNGGPAAPRPRVGPATDALVLDLTEA